MNTDNEVERLQKVYKQYHESKLCQAKWSENNLGNQACLRERHKIIRHLLNLHGFLPLTQKNILDLGCGTGKMLAIFKEWGVFPNNLFGVDLLPDRILQARESLPDISFQVGNAEYLHFQDYSFDLVIISTVFSSILDAKMALKVAGEVNRVLKPRGAIIWYDFFFDNPFNSHVKGMRKKEIQVLFPNYNPILQKVTLLPLLARRLGIMTNLLYPILVFFPFLRTHYLGILIKINN